MNSWRYAFSEDALARGERALVGGLRREKAAATERTPREVGGVDGGERDDRARAPMLALVCRLRLTGGVDGGVQGVIHVFAGLGLELC